MSTRSACCPRRSSGGRPLGDVPGRPAGRRAGAGADEQAGAVARGGVSGGKFYTPETAATLLDDLPKPEKVPLDTDPPIPLWNTWPVLGLFLAMLTVEWLLRKRKQMV